MVLTLEVTGEAVLEGSSLASLLLDDKNQIKMEYDALRTIIGQLVAAINTQGTQIAQLRDEDELLSDSVQNLEQTLSTFEVRTRECEDSCQEIRLQLGTMMDAKIQEKEAPTAVVKSEVSRKDYTELVSRVDNLGTRFERESKHQLTEFNSLHKQVETVEGTLHSHAEFLDETLEARLTDNDADRIALKGEIDAVRQSVDDINFRKAGKLEMNDIQRDVQTLEKGQRDSEATLADAQKNFVKLDGLTDLVTDNQTRMQEMWGQFGNESQDLRRWAASNFAELKDGVRSKMSQQETLSHIAELRKDVRELAPFVSEAMERVEGRLRNKAGVGEIQRMKDGIEELNRATGRPKQLLVGTKCLACDRTVTSAEHTDKGPVSLNDRRYKEELWDEVQRALDKKPDNTQAGTKDVLQYLAIHVGAPTQAGNLAGKGLFETRENSPDRFNNAVLMRAGAGSAGPHGSRPQSRHQAPRPQSTPAGHSGRVWESSTLPSASPPREVPPIVRMSPRRPGPPEKTCNVKDGRADKHGNLKAFAMRDAMGVATGKLSQSPPPVPYHEAIAAARDRDSQYAPVRMQPGAHSNMPQISASERRESADYLGDSPSPDSAYVIDHM